MKHIERCTKYTDGMCSTTGKKCTKLCAEYVDAYDTIETPMRRCKDCSAVLDHNGACPQCDAIDGAGIFS